MKILTHNVYWFQGHPPRWGHEKVAEVPEVLEALTRLYASAGVDLFCLQEVHRNPDSPPYRFMLESGYMDASVVAGDDTVLKQRVDYIWLDQTWADRMTGFAVLNSGGFCRTTPEGDAWRLSDHPPLLMEVR